MLKPRFETSALDDRKAFRDGLARWFSKHGKDYPWRRTRDPYEVLISEVMLQQTQIATVLGKGYYTRFLETFPNVASLAKAEDARHAEGVGGAWLLPPCQDVARNGAGCHRGSRRECFRRTLSC